MVRRRRAGRDLTLPKLRARWDPARAGAGPCPGSAERNETWDYAARTAAEASAAIGDLRGTDPAAASDIASAAADVLRAARLRSAAGYVSRDRPLPTSRLWSGWRRWPRRSASCGGLAGQ